MRVLLERLRDAETAAELAKRAGSKEASLAVAQHCEHAGLPQLAMEQYWLAGESRLAFWLAKKCDAVPAFAAWARQAGDAAAALLAAEHFEAQGSLAVAAELCAQAGQAERAARLYIQVGCSKSEGFCLMPGVGALSVGGTGPSSSLCCQTPGLENTPLSRLQAGGDSLPAAIKLASEGRDPAAVALVLEHLQASQGSVVWKPSAAGMQRFASTLTTRRPGRHPSPGFDSAHMIGVRSSQLTPQAVTHCIAGSGLHGRNPSRPAHGVGQCRGGVRRGGGSGATRADRWQLQGGLAAAF